MIEPEVLYEDNHLLVLNKPSGWIVQGAQANDPSVLEWGKAYLKAKYQKPGSVFLAAVSRLDREVSGVVPLARTSKAAARMNSEIQSRGVGKLYLAVVNPIPTNDRLQLTHYLIRDEQHAKTIAYPSPIAGSSDAILDYEVLQIRNENALLKIQLRTGRKHQIRCQLEAIGCPIVGDRKYGSTIAMNQQIALHCFQFELKHPTRDERLTFKSKPPQSWSRFQFSFDLEVYG